MPFRDTTPANTAIASAVMTGLITVAGAIGAGTGFSVVKGGAGVYTVSFTTPYPVAPCVIAQFIGPTLNAAAFLDIYNVTANGFQVQAYDRLGNAADIAFNFTAQTFV